MGQSGSWGVVTRGQSSARFAKTPFAHAIKDELDDGIVLFCENRYGLDGGQTLGEAFISYETPSTTH